MRLLLTAVLATLGCNAVEASEPRDPYRDANLCEEVSSGAVPLKIGEGDELFNAGDLALRGDELYFRTSNRGGYAGGVHRLNLSTGGAARMASGEIEELAVGPSSLFWFEHWRGLFKRGSWGSTDGWDTGDRWIDALAADPTADRVWFTKASGEANDGGTLYLLEDGQLYTMARGGFGHALAVTRAGVWAITRFGLGADMHGEVVFSPHGRDEWNKLYEYARNTQQTLRADDTGAVYLFDGELGAIDASGERRTLHTGGSYEHLAIDATHAYFTQRTRYGTEIRRVARDGSGKVETLTETRCPPKSLAAGEGHVFFTTYAWDYYKPSPGAVWSIPTP